MKGYDPHGYWDRPENESMGDNHAGMIKDIISKIHPKGGTREDYQMLVAKQVPDAYSRTPEFVQDFNDAYDEFYREKISGNDEMGQPCPTKGMKRAYRADGTFYFIKK